jgi:integrase/recombinase XerD
LTEEELIQLYNQYLVKTNQQIRNKVMLGLMIFQGLSTKELNRLLLEEVDLTTRSVIVKGSRKSNERTIQLQKEQIQVLRKYIHKIRPELINEKGKDTDKLIVNTGNSENVEYLLKSFLQQLKKLNDKVNNFQQIMLFVPKFYQYCKKFYFFFSLFQYMAGHRYASSTERFNHNRLEDLTEDLKMHHPLK